MSNLFESYVILYITKTVIEDDKWWLMFESYVILYIAQTHITSAMQSVKFDSYVVFLLSKREFWGGVGRICAQMNFLVNIMKVRMKKGGNYFD